MCTKQNKFCAISEKILSMIIWIKGNDEERVKSFKYLDTILDQKLNHFSSGNLDVTKGFKILYAISHPTSDWLPASDGQSLWRF